MSKISMQSYQEAPPSTDESTRQIARAPGCTHDGVNDERAERLPDYLAQLPQERGQLSDCQRPEGS